jgi:hypothetical protein
VIESPNGMMRVGLSDGTAVDVAVVMNKTLKRVPATKAGSMSLPIEGLNFNLILAPEFLKTRLKMVYCAF